MSEDVLHTHARQLIVQERVEDLSTEDREWLSRHLEACAECAGYRASADRALRSFRSVSVQLNPSLASQTQLLVRLRALEMSEQKPRRWALWVSCALSWILGAASAPFVWRGFEWIGHRASLPNLVWEMGFVLWWAVPALAAAGVMLALSPSRVASERPHY